MTDLSARITLGAESAAQSENGVSFFPEEQIEAGKAYAKYVIFGSEDGGNISKPAEPSAVNADITRGALRADYVAQLGADEADGRTFSFVGLSCDGETLLCRGDFTPVPKEAGKPLSACVTVFLNPKADGGKILFGGDNPLVKFLLGVSDLPENVMSVIGDCDRLNEYTNRGLYDLYNYTETGPKDLTNDAELYNAYNLTETGSKDLTDDVKLYNLYNFERTCTKDLTKNGVEITALTEAGDTELLVFMGSRPVFRVFLRSGTDMRIVTNAEVSGDNCIPLSYEDIASVSYVRGVSANYTDCILVNCVGKAYRLYTGLGFCVGRGAVLRTDDLGEYAAIGGDKEIMFLKKGDDVPKLLYRVPRDKDDDFAVCSGGYLVRIGEKITVFDTDGASSEYDVSRGERNAIARDGSVFHFAKVAGGAVQRYLLSDGVAEPLPSLQNMSGDVKIFRSFFRIGVVSDSGCYFLDRYGGVDTEFAQCVSERLGTLVKRAGGAKNTECGGAFVKFSENGKQVAACVSSDDEFEYTDVQDVALFGDFALCKSENGVSARAFDRATRKVKEISGISPNSEIGSAGRIGSHLLIVGGSGGEVELYHLSRDGAYIYCPSALVGEKVTAAVRVRREGKKGRVKIFCGKLL